MKAVFCDLVLIATPGGEYGDYIVKQSVTKEERAARKEMPILGNGKVWGDRPASSAPPPQDNEPPPQGDDVPF